MNDTRQLLPKLSLSPATVTRFLNAGKLDLLISHIKDTDELGGTYGCMFNYFYNGVIGDGSSKQPALLLMIRIAQFVERNNSCNAEEVYEFMRAIGYDFPEDVLAFALFVILRSEIVKWDGGAGAKTMGDVPLYLTTAGWIGINRILFSVTYCSEAILSSVQIDRELCSFLRRRNPDLSFWIADTLCNASIALFQIGRIEAIEVKASGLAGIDMDQYLVYDHLKSVLEGEARGIKGSLHGSGRVRLEENTRSLESLSEKYPDFVILGA